MKLKIIDRMLADLLLIDHEEFCDERGFFMETYNQEELRSIGIDTPFVQDNQSWSRAGVIRGLHFQKVHPQAKLIKVVRGKIFDVAVDVRRKSNNFGKYAFVSLTASCTHSLYIPAGYAHGFAALEHGTIVHYKCSSYYDPTDPSGVIWNDPTIGIAWPATPQVIVSKKDQALPKLENIEGM